MEENKTRQLEEIEALSSIYEDALTIDSEDNYSVRIEEEGTKAELYLSLDPGYPSEGPPTYTLSAPTISSSLRQELCNGLERVYLENIGECVVFLWIEEIRTFLQAHPAAREPSVSKEDASLPSDDNSIICDRISELELVEVPEIITGECFEDRKSVFQGHVAIVSSLEQVKAVINKLYENKKIANATHNMYAYRIYCEDKKTWLQDCDDDGEDAAGGRMLHLLEILDSKNILVVVSRWYGGIKLGPDRFKLINNSARQVMEQAGLINQEKATKKKKK
eukprot:TRINITY_DN33723_c0_g1_i1.p1 TRINITY_DN33723_c0_g1~~TRINITY_DN33723_c0_g1_i1.p1  ORF type:complete len:278 (-),score=51.39 TRINITY_DN33723_c0_g1_i1:239-1072(-)